MSKQTNLKAYEEFLERNESTNRKKASAARGKIAVEPAKNAERASFDKLLKKAQEGGDDSSLKRKLA